MNAELLQNIWLFFLAVVFVAINGVTQMSYAASLGYALKPTAFAYFTGAIGNLLTGSITPVAGQAETMTLTGLMKRMGERVCALLIAAVVGILMGIFGGVSAISEFAGPAVIFGMMSGVGLILSSVSLEMFNQEKRTGLISIVSALLIWAFTRDVVYTVAGSVLISTIDFSLIQKRRVDLKAIALKNGQNVNTIQTDNWRFWTKDYWREFTLIKPIVNVVSIMGGLSFICLNIGSNTAFGNITASMAQTTQNLDHLSIINSLADVPSILCGGAPIEAIISGTAAAPWPVAAGIAMMFLTGILLFVGLVGKISKFCPAQSISGFLLIIGFVLTFVPNLTSSLASDHPIDGAVALGVTALTKNPFFGMAAGVLTRYLGKFIGL
jgi:AGZA family xanthine/uracil permease-like MFS transporter